MFNYYAPLRIVFAEGAISNIAKLTARNGSRVLLVIGRHHLKESGMLDKILSLFFSNKKIEKLILFDKATANPDVSIVDEAAQIIKKNNLNIVVAVGGGSSMDLAKAASVSARYNRPIWDIICDNDLFITDALPVICVPTTSGSGSEVTKYAVLNNNDKKVKVAISSEAIYPKVSIIDPELTYTMNPHIAASTGFDALSHAIEAYTSNSSSCITDMYCEKAISIIAAYLRNAVKKDRESMKQMSFAAALGGLALNIGRASLPHAMEHALSAYNPGLAHGFGLAIIMEEFIQRAYKYNENKFANIAYLLDRSAERRESRAAEKLPAIINALKKDIGLNQKLSDFGFDEKVVKDMVENTFWTMKHGIENAPGKFSKSDIEDMYIKCL